jgi:cystathionine beta-lyase/cystathionine gamma-synthase
LWLEVFLLAESLGGVESLIEQPWTMSHASMGEAGLRDSGMTPQTVRVSVGLEHPDDLITDLERGFAAIA